MATTTRTPMRRLTPFLLLLALCPLTARAQITPPVDSDGDGVPDGVERANCSDPNDASVAFTVSHCDLFGIDGTLGLTWSTKGPLPHQSCVRVGDDGETTWSNTYLCSSAVVGLAWADAPVNGASCLGFSVPS